MLTGVAEVLSCISMVISNGKYPITMGAIVYVGSVIYVHGVQLPWPWAVRGQFCEVCFPTSSLRRFLGIEQRSHACVEIAFYLVSRLIALKSFFISYLHIYLEKDLFKSSVCWEWRVVLVMGLSGRSSLPSLELSLPSLK